MSTLRFRHPTRIAELPALLLAVVTDSARDIARDIAPAVLPPALALLALLGSPAPLTAQPAPAGPLQRVDLGPCCPEAPVRYQVSPAVVPLAGGGYAVVWAHRLHGIVEPFPGWKDFRGRILDATGTPVGAEFPVAAEGGEHPYFRLVAAALTGGGFVAVWTVYDDGDGPGVLARVFDRDGEPLGPPRGVPAATPGYQHSPRAVGLADGGFVVAWRREPLDGAPGHGAFVRRFDARGTPSGDDVAILPEASANPWDPGPDVAALTGGGFVATAFADTPEPNRDAVAFARIFDSDGHPRGDPFAVPGLRGVGLPWGGFAVSGREGAQRFDRQGQPRGEPVPLDHDPSAMASDPWGNLFLVGTRSSRERGADVTAQFLAARSTEAVTVPGPGPGATRHYEVTPDVAAGSDGSFVVVWTLETGLSARPEDDTGLGVLARRFVYKSAPGHLEPGFRRLVVEEDTAHPQIPVVRVGGSRGPLTVRYSLQGVEAEVQRDLGDAEGSLTFPDGDSTPRTVSVPLFEDARPERDERFLVLLDQVVEGEPRHDRVVVEIRDDDRSSPLVDGVEPPFQVGPGGLSPPRIVADRRGGFVVAWTRGDTSSSGERIDSLQARRIDRDGRILADVVRTPEADRYLRLRGLTASRAGFLMSWDDVYYDESADLERPFPTAQRFHLSGAEAGPPFPVRGHALAAFPFGNVAVASVQDDGDETGVFVDYHSTTGEVVGTFRANDATTGFQLHPDLAADAEGGLVVVWESFLPNRPGGDILLRRFDLTGTALSPEIRVTPPSTRQAAAPRVTVDSRGRSVVLWWGEGAEGTGFYARAFHASGRPAGEVFPVDVSGESGLRTVRSVALRDDGRFLVIGENRLHGDVLGRSFAFPGVSLGRALRLLPEVGAPVARVAVGPTGPFLVTWGEERGIHARALDTPPARPRRLRGGEEGASVSFPHDRYAVPGLPGRLPGSRRLGGLSRARPPRR